jgi:ribonuclease BN (tRNA processing enzyme)
MRLDFLGTSHGSHTYCRYNSATLLEVADFHHVMDCGEPVTGTLVRPGTGLRRLRAVFVTHLHAAYVGGLAQLTNMLLKDGDGKQEPGCFLPAEGVANLEVYLRTLYLNLDGPLTRARLRPVQPGPREVPKLICGVYAG